MLDILQYQILKSSDLLISSECRPLQVESCTIWENNYFSFGFSLKMFSLDGALFPHIPPPCPHMFSDKMFLPQPSLPWPSIFTQLLIILSH